MEVKLLQHQWDSLTSKSKYTLMLGGIGSGKTWAGCHWVIKSVAEHPNSLGFIGANTFAQLRNSTLAAVFNELSRLEIPFSYNQSSGYLEIYNKKILCKSLDNYDSIRGIEIGEFWLDECAYAKKEAFDVVCGRLRDKKGPLKGLLTTSPNSFNWLYDYFSESGELHTKDYQLVQAKSKENIHLPDGYLDSLYEQYDSEMIKQELEGEFINIKSGRVYYAFDRNVNVDNFERVGYPIRVGMDFNVNPMTAICAEVYNDTIYIFDEVYLKNSNTFEMSDELAKRYGTKIEVIPDSTGVARKTSSKKSDHAILMEKGFSVISNKNPFVEDRFNCVNGLLDKKRIIIHPKCKMLIKDLEQMSHDNKDPMLSHISDSLGYLCWKLYPLKKRKRKSSIITL